MNTRTFLLVPALSGALLTGLATTQQDHARIPLPSQPPTTGAVTPDHGRPRLPVPESWTPHTLHVGVEGTGAELDSSDTGELTADPKVADPGDGSGTAAVAAWLRGDPYRLSYVGGDYVPAPGERVDPALAHAISTGTDRVTYGFVMFEGRITSAKRAAVEALGVRLFDHHTFNCMTAVIPIATLGELARSAAVRWVGYARPQQKIEPALRELVRRSTHDELNHTRTLLVKVYASDLTPNARLVPIAEAGGDERATALADWAVIPEGPFQRLLEQDGASVRAYYDDLRLFAVSAPLASVERIARRDFVHWIQLDERIEPAHDRSTRQIGIDYIRGLATSDGHDTVVGMMDSGMDVTHVDTQVKWYAGWGYDGQSVYIDSTGHGTHVMGTIMSPGIGNDRFRGCAPEVGRTNDRRIYVAGIFGGPGGGSTSNNAIAAFSRFATPITLSNVTTPIPSVVNHSWGVGTSNMPANGWVGTDALSIALDYRVFYDRQTHVVAAHNQGGSDYGSESYNNVLQPAVAKLAFTVANCTSARDADGSLPGRPHFTSNKGPTGDGRLCPQIMAPGRGIGSVSAGTTNQYVSFNGTSMATPHVVGTIAGMHTHFPWMKTSPAATRAVVAATSNPYEATRSFVQTSESYYHRQGFGQVDAYKANYQRDVAGGFRAGRVYGTFTSASTGFSFDLDIPADAERTTFVLAFDEKPASEGAVRACIHDLDLYLDVEPFTPGFDTGEYWSTRPWDTWDWYQNIASLPNIRGKTVRVKIHPRVRPTGSDVVHFGLAYLVPRGTTQPAGTIAAGASPLWVQSGDPVDLSAVVTVPEYVQSNSFVDISNASGFTPTQLEFRDRENLLRTYTGSVPDNWTLGLQGDWYASAHRSLEWRLTAPNANGWLPLTVRLQADNRVGSTSDTVLVCVDNSPPNQIQGLASTTHTPNVWSNQPSITLTWDLASDNGCAGVAGLGYRFSLGGTQVPPSINLSAASTQLVAALASSAQTQFFTLRPFDRAGNTTLHRFAGPFLIDLETPVLSSVVIDAGASYTTDTIVDVALVASDAPSGVGEVRWTLDGVTWSPWTAWAPALQVDITTYGGNADEGLKTVRVQVRDHAGNLSALRGDSITYQRCPLLRRVAPGTLDNVTDGRFELTGLDLGDATAVRFGSQVITSQSSLDQATGWYQIVDDQTLHLYPPQGLRPGSYPLSVENRVCRSNVLSAQLVCNATPRLLIASQVDAGTGFTAFVAAGSLSPQTLVGLAISPSNVPSIAPGVVSLSIGNQFSELLLVPNTATIDPLTCTATFTLPSVPSMQGTTLLFQSFLVDLQSQSPLPAVTTNVDAVTFV